MRFGRLLGFWVLTLASCAPRASPGPGAQRGQHASPAPAPPAAAFEPGVPSDEELWRQAMHGDPLDLERLANQEGSTGLLVRAQAGGALATTALEALPFARDAELALGALCDSLKAGRGGIAALRAVHGIALRGPSSERLDLDGERRCVAILRTLEQAQALEPAARDLAASARMLLERYRRP